MKHLPGQQEVQLSSRVILRTYDGKVVVRPIVDIDTTVRQGVTVARFTADGARLWNAGLELTAECFWPFADLRRLARAEF